MFRRTCAKVRILFQISATFKEFFTYFHSVASSLLGHLLHFSSIGVERNHGEGLAQLRVARADVGAVAATQTVED